MYILFLKYIKYILQLQIKTIQIHIGSIYTHTVNKTIVSILTSYCLFSNEKYIPKEFFNMNIASIKIKFLNLSNILLNILQHNLTLACP